MWKELFFYISQLVISSAGQPLTPLRDPDTHKGSVPTDVKEVEKQFNTKKGGGGCVKRIWGTERQEMGLKRFQQVKIVCCVVSFHERRLKNYLDRFKTLWGFLSYLFKIVFFFLKWKLQKKKKMNVSHVNAPTKV